MGKFVAQHGTTNGAADGRGRLSRTLPELVSDQGAAAGTEGFRAGAEHERKQKDGGNRRVPKCVKETIAGLRHRFLLELFIFR
jgi:hypothetical protein